MRSKYSDSRRCAAAFIRFAIDRFDHNRRRCAIGSWNYFINDRKISGFKPRKDDAVVLAAGLRWGADRRGPLWRWLPRAHRCDQVRRFDPAPPAREAVPAPRHPDVALDAHRVDVDIASAIAADLLQL